MTSTTDTVSFVPALKLLSIIAVSIGILVGVMFFFNKRRNDAIVKTYTEETLKYESDNTQGLKILFTEIFDQGSSCAKNKNYELEQACHDLVRTTIYKNLTTNLKDFSSTFFIRLNGDKVETLTLDGEVREAGYQYDNTGKKDTTILSLLQNKVSKVAWDDYFYTMSGKQVVIPVDYQGKRLGAIVRRVIEN